MNAVSFQRLYADSAGLEHEASPERIATVIRSANEHARGSDPFKVRVVFGDGTVVVVSPKRQRAR